MNPILFIDMGKTNPVLRHERSSSTEQCHVWIDDVLGETEFLLAHYTAHEFRPHFHETFAIGIIESGGQWFRTERRSDLVMPAETLCVINPGIVHIGRAASDLGWTYRMFYPSTDLIHRALGDQKTNRIPGFRTHVIDAPALYQQFRRLHQVSQLHETALERESRTYCFINDLFVRHAEDALQALNQGDERTAAKRVQEFIHAHWDQALRIDELSNVAGLSETHTIRSFSRRIGMPPHGYQQALRVERAKALIRLRLPLVEVTAAAAFYDQSQMTRHFKKDSGMTPGQYAFLTTGKGKAEIAKTTLRDSNKLSTRAGSDAH